MPTVTFGHTNKRINSTMTGMANTTALSCKFKEPCDSENPVLIVQGLSGTGYNYCRIPNWGYYWITNIVQTTNVIQEVHCQIDPLATYKSEILQCPAFVEYTGLSTMWNRKVDDIRWHPEVQLPITPTSTKFDLVPHDYFTPAKAGGTVVLRVLSMPINTGGSEAPAGVFGYAMSLADAQRCLTDLSAVFISMTSGNQLTEAVCKLWGAVGGAGSWSDNLLSVIYLPIDISTYEHVEGAVSVDGIWFGGVPIDVTPLTVYQIPAVNYMYGKDETLTIPWDQLHTDLQFLKNPRWCSMQLIYPGGCQAIDITNLKDQTSLGWYSCIDLCTGEWSGRLTEKGIDSSQTIASVSGCIGVDMRGLVNTRNNDTGILAGLGAVAGLVLGGIGGGVGMSVVESAMAAGTNAAVGAGIGGVFGNMGCKVSALSGGLGNGGTALYTCDVGASGGSFGKCILTPVFYKPAGLSNLAGYQSFCQRQGYPCNGSFDNLTAFSGYYVKCVNFSFEGNTAASVAKINSIKAINTFMNGPGVYLNQ